MSLIPPHPKRPTHEPGREISSNTDGPNYVKPLAVLNALRPVDKPLFGCSLEGPFVLSAQ
jgi:hypothetical protein